MGVGDIVLECCCADVSVMQSVFPVRQKRGRESKRKDERVLKYLQQEHIDGTTVDYTAPNVKRHCSEKVLGALKSVSGAHLTLHDVTTVWERTVDVKRERGGSIGAHGPH